MVDTAVRTTMTPLVSPDNGKIEFGSSKSIRIHCLSEIGWHDDHTLMKDINNAGGHQTADQWFMEWDEENAAGSCTLVEVTHHNDEKTMFLMDTGWNAQYIDEIFRREGIDELLVEGKIEFLYISHEHMDHFWGLEAVLRYRPDIPILIPDTFSEIALDFISGKIPPASEAENHIIHRGPLHRLTPGEVYQLAEGIASVGFDLPLNLGVKGEQSLYVSLKDKGMVCISGCCHQNVLNLAGFARDNLAGGDKMYGLYGGLHISPHGAFTPDAEQIIQGMRDFEFSKIACNHCTGILAVDKMREIGLPVEMGTGQHGSLTDQYVGNGEVVDF